MPPKIDLLAVMLPQPLPPFLPNASTPPSSLSITYTSVAQGIQTLLVTPEVVCSWQSSDEEKKKICISHEDARIA